VKTTWAKKESERARESKMVLKKGGQKEGYGLVSFASLSTQVQCITKQAD
jgi:hypothetical protein